MATILLTAVVASAESVPPPRSSIGGEAITFAAATPTDRVRTLRLGSYSVEFEKTRLDEIRERIGAGQAARAGDASEAIRWYCYSLPGQLIWLVSGELGGGDVLTGVAVDSIEPSDPRMLSCPMIPKGLRPLTLEFGWLGTSRSSLEQSLGKPSSVRGDWLIFYYAGKTHDHDRRPGKTASRIEYDVSALVEVKIDGEKVVGLRASHATSD